MGRAKGWVGMFGRDSRPVETRQQLCIKPLIPIRCEEELVSIVVLQKVTGILRSGVDHPIMLYDLVEDQTVARDQKSLCVMCGRSYQTCQHEHHDRTSVIDQQCLRHLGVPE